MPATADAAPDVAPSPVLDRKALSLQLSVAKRRAANQATRAKSEVEQALARESKLKEELQAAHQARLEVQGRASVAALLAERAIQDIERRLRESASPAIGEARKEVENLFKETADSPNARRDAVKLDRVARSIPVARRNLDEIALEHVDDAELADILKQLLEDCREGRLAPDAKPHIKYHPALSDLLRRMARREEEFRTNYHLERFTERAERALAREVAAINEARQRVVAAWGEGMRGEQLKAEVGAAQASWEAARMTPGELRGAPVADPDQADEQADADSE